MSNAFTINFIKGENERVTVISKSLDKDIHPSGSLDLLIESTRDGKIAGSVSIEAFQLNSLTAYLLEHKVLKPKIQLELLNDREKCVGEQMTLPSEIWNVSPFAYLFLPSFEHCVAEDGIEDGKPIFTAAFKVDWDDEHDHRTLKFHAGSFVQMTMEDL